MAINRDYPIDVVTRAAEFYSNYDFTVPSKSTIRGFRLEATDGTFVTGSGPLVQGTTVALTMVMAGRASYCTELTGDGVQALRQRL